MLRPSGLRSGGLTPRSEESELWVDPFILEAAAWGEGEIAERAKRLGAAGYDEVWSL
jgi:hypothetical protein